MKRKTKLKKMLKKLNLRKKKKIKKVDHKMQYQILKREQQKKHLRKEK